MLKKVMIGIIIFFISFFIYTTYFKKDNMEYNENEKVTYQDVKYTNGIYTLKAKEQIENKENNTITFKKVEAYFKESLLKADKAIKNEQQDIALTGHVTGENSKNGWIIKGKELIYHKDLDRINSNTKVEAYNKKKKLKISGNYLESTTDFNEILLDGAVDTATDNFEMIAEKAYYKGEILELMGNVETEIKSLNKTNSKDKSIVGVFPGAIYNTKTRILKATGAYKMFYKEFVINANELIYDENTDIITTKGNVTINGKDFFGTFPEASFNMKEDKIYLTGPIKATYNDMNFTGEKGVYDNNKDTFEVTGKAVVTSKDSVLNAERIIYTKKTDTVEVFGNNGKFNYIGSDKEIIGTYAKYIVNKNRVEVPGKFDFKYLSNPKEEIKGSAESLILDTSTQKGQAKNPILYDGKDNIKGNNGELDFINGIYKLQGKVVGDYGDYLINAEEIDYKEKDKIITTDKSYVITGKKSKIKIYGNNVTLNIEKYFVTTLGKTNFENEESNSYGTNLNYDLNKKEGTFDKEVYVKALKTKVQIYADNAKFKVGDYVMLGNNVKALHETIKITSNEVVYSYKDETITMPKIAYISSTENGMEGRTESGLYDTKTRKYTGHNFDGWSEKATIKSNYIYYDMIKLESYLNGNIELKDKENGTKIKGTEIVYYIKTDIINSQEPLEINKDNLYIQSKNGTANLNEKTLKLEKTSLTTDKKDKISGDILQANLIKNEFKFNGNIEGVLYSLNSKQLSGMEDVDYSNPIRFKGDMTKAFFIKNGDNKYVITRDEIINGSEFYYKDMKLEGDYIELENDVQKVFAKGNSRILLNNGNKIAAESIVIDMLNELTNLKNNVTITNTSESTGGINTRADKAIFRNKENLVDLDGNIESYKGKSKIQADKGVYDLVNNKLNGKGNILLSLDFATADQTKEKQKKDKEINDKIKKVQLATEPKNILNVDVNSIELKKQYEGVEIVWKSSNEDYIAETGEVKHPYYSENDITVELTATYIYQDNITKKTFEILIKKQDKKTYIKNYMDKELLYIEGRRALLKEDNNNNIVVKIQSSNEKLMDNAGNIKTDDLSKFNGFGIKLIYTFEETVLMKEYRGSYLDGRLKFISLPF